MYTNIHAYSSLGKCLSNKFERKKAYVSLTLGAEDGCVFLCHLAELIHFVLDEGLNSGWQKQKLLPTILAPRHFK